MTYADRNRLDYGMAVFYNVQEHIKWSIPYTKNAESRVIEIELYSGFHKMKRGSYGKGRVISYILMLSVS